MKNICRKRTKLTALIAAAVLSLTGLIVLCNFAYAANANYCYTAVQDTYMSAASAADKALTHGADTSVKAGNSSNTRAFVQFDISSFLSSGTEITTAELTLSVSSFTGDNFSGLKIRAEKGETGNNWDENALCWNNRTEQGLGFLQADELAVTVRYDSATKILRILLPKTVFAGNTYVSQAGLITFGIACSPTVNFYTKEGAAADGTFAPYIEFNRSYGAECSVNDNAMGKAEVSAQMVAAGGEVTFTVTPFAGYKLKKAELNGKDVTALLTLNESFYNYTITNVSEDLSLYVTFISESVLTYEVTAESGSNGTVTSSAAVVDAGQEVTFSILPDAHYIVETALLNGEDVKNEVSDQGKLTVTVNGDVHLKVTFIASESRYTLSVNVTGGLGKVYFGEDEASAEITLWESEWASGGGITILNVLPAAFYRVESVSTEKGNINVTDYKALIPNSYVTKNTEINVAFAVVPVTDASTEFFPYADTMVSSMSAAAKNTVYGADGTVYIKSATNNVRAMLLSFDITHVTDFSQVLLKIYNAYSSTSPLGGFRLDAYAFTDLEIEENFATWNSLALDDMFKDNPDGAGTVNKKSLKGTVAAVAESGSIAKKSYIEFDVTSFTSAAKMTGAHKVTFLILNTELASKDSKPLEIATKESNLLVDGVFVRPHLFVTKSSGEGPITPESEFSVNVTGTSRVKLNGQQTAAAVFTRYTPVTVDLSSQQSGKAILTVKVNGRETSVTDGKIYLNGCDTDVTIDVILTNEYYIEITAGEHIRTDTFEIAVSEGKTAVLHFAADIGYRAEVKVDGVLYSAYDNTIVLEDVTDDVTITVTAVKL